MIEPLPDLLIEPVVLAALEEDLGRAGDLTSQACIPADARFAAVFAARKPGVIAGLDCARIAIEALDPSAEVRLLAADGDSVSAGAKLGWVEPAGGPLR